VSEPALALEGVRKSFGRNEVLRGIDLEVAQHEVVCLIGASGSGKSTLLRCVNLIEPIDGGRIVLAGEEITRRGVDVNAVRRRIGIVFQAFNQSQIDTNATFTYGAYLAAAALFVAITIPLARLTDWLIARDRRRRQAGALA